MTQWYYASGGQRMGPLSTDQLRLLVQTRQVHPNTLVWADGMAQWAALQTVPELAEAPAAPVEAMPPPVASPLPLGYVATAAATDIPATPQAIEHLRRTQPWVRFLSVLLFIGAAISFFMAPFVFAIESNVRKSEREPRWITLVALLVASIFYGCFAVLIGRYASAIRRLSREGTATHLEAALRAECAFWRTLGVMVLVFVILYAIVCMVAACVGFFH